MKEPLYEFVADRVARITTRDGQLVASAAVVAPQGLLITVAHAVAGYAPKDILIDFSGLTVSVVGIAELSQIDIAIIYPASIKPVLSHFVVDVAPVQLGRRVIVYGWPARTADHPYYRLTEIASGRTIQDDVRHVRVLGFTDKHILSPGMSGSPVADAETGALIGVALGFDKAEGLPLIDKDDNVIYRTIDRLDDYFIPARLAMDADPSLWQLVTVIDKSKHTELIEKAAEALRLLGFSCGITDPTSAQRPVVEARLRLGPVSMEILATAVASTDDQAERVALHDGVRVAESLGKRHFDKVIVVHDRVDDHQLRDTYGLTERMVLVKVDELLPTLIDIAPYLDAVVTRWQNDRRGIADKYIPLTGSKLVDAGPPQFLGDIEEWILDWLDGEQSRKLLVLGPFGSGKTTLIQRLAFRIASRSRQRRPESSLVPLVIRLRDVRTHSLEHIIAGLLRQDLGARTADADLYRKLGQTGQMIALLDGLDEMSSAPQHGTPFEHMREIISVVREPQKMLITARTEYFVEDEEISSLTTMYDFDSLSVDDQFDVVYLDNFDDRQIDQYLDAVMGAEGSVGRELMGQVENLRELAHRPILLDMIVSTIDSLRSVRRRINLATLYRSYVDRWLSRDSVFGRTSFPREAKEEFLAMIASEMNITGSLAIPHQRVLDLLSRYLGGDVSRAAFHVRDVLTNSLLTRNERSGTYEFVHKSIFEYLLANQVVRAFHASDPVRALTVAGVSARGLGVGAIRFIVDMEPNHETMWTVLESTRHRDSAEIPLLAGNLVSLMHAAGGVLADRNFDAMRFSDAVLTGADLSRSSFRGSVLFNCALVNTVLDDVDMTGAEVTRTDFKAGRVINSVTASPSRPVLVSDNSSGNRATLWELSADGLELVDTSRLVGHQDPVFTVRFSPSGHLVATAGQDQTVRLWDVESKQVVTVFRELVGDVRSIAFARDDLLVSCSIDGQIIYWDLNRRRAELIVRTDLELWGLDMDTSSDTLVTGALCGTVSVRRLSDASLRTQRNLAGPQPRRHSVRAVPGTSEVLAGAEGGALMWWNHATDQWRGAKASTGSAIKCVAISHDSERIVAGHDDGGISVWGRDIVELRSWRGHDNLVSDIVFPRWSQYFVSCSPDGTLKLWSSEDGALIWTMADEFPDYHFSCSGLILRDVRGLPDQMRRRLIALGAHG